MNPFSTRDQRRTVWSDVEPAKPVKTTRIVGMLRRWSKELLCRWMCIIEYCHDCGVRQPLYWWADNALWSEITGEQPVEGDNMPGILCPTCFGKRAMSMGILLKWTPTIDLRSEPKL